MNLDLSWPQKRSSTSVDVIPLQSLSNVGSTSELRPAGAMQRGKDYSYDGANNMLPTHEFTKSRDRITRRNRKAATYPIKWLAVTILVSFIIAIPMIVLKDSLQGTDVADLADIELIYRNQWRNLGFWICAWLLVCWISLCFWHLIAKALPYAFRRVCEYINPAHVRYWKIFRFLKWPVTALGGIVFGFVAYALMIYSNGILIANVPFSSTLAGLPGANTTYQTDDNNNNTYAIVTIDGFTFDDYNSKMTLYTIEDVLENVLFNIILWICLWFFEKLVILYIAIHYNSRSNFGQLEHFKDIIQALVKLYDASVYRFPVEYGAFGNDDAIISGQEKGQEKDFAKDSFMSTGTKHLTSALGYLVNSSDDSHWFQSRSSYAVVSHALSDPETSTALAHRIWMGLVSKETNTLTLQNIRTALSNDLNADVDIDKLAKAIFELLDENENGNIQFEEFASLTVGVGKARRNTYKALSDVNHSLNTFDWVLCIILAVAMIFFILVSYVPQIKLLRDNISLVVVGAAFIVGRIGHEFFAGAIFLFFKHPFDVGDNVWLYNTPETSYVKCIVKRLSLLYVVFERIDNGIELQMPNDKLNTKRIENVSRSGQNREKIEINIDYDTTFQEIQSLRKELIKFVSSGENKRHYRPGVAVKIAAIPDLQKITLSVSFWHKSNWADDAIRASRSSNFVCKLLQVVRNIHISKPGMEPYKVHITEEAAATKRSAEKQRLEERMDYNVKPVADEKEHAPMDTTLLSEDEIAELENKTQKEEEEKKKAALAEQEAMEYLSAIPSAAVAWDGLRNRRKN